MGTFLNLFQLIFLVKACSFPFLFSTGGSKSKRPHYESKRPQIKRSPPRVKTSPFLIVYILILFIFLFFLFHLVFWRRCRSYLATEFLERSSSRKMMFLCMMMMWQCVLCLRKYLFSLHYLYHYVSIYIILLFTFIIILLKKKNISFDFWRFCVVIWFFHPHHNSQWPPTLKDFYTRSYPLHYFLILILEKESLLILYMS